MSTQPISATADAGTARFSIEHYAAFWDAPSLSDSADVLSPDVTGDWSGDPEPVRGVEAYVGRLGAVLAMVPDIRLEVQSHASNGDVTFIHWLATGTGTEGRFAIDGIDRVRVDEEGHVIENVIRFDPAGLEAAIGGAQPAPSGG